MTRFDIAKREFSAQEREALAEEGKAMPDGSYPIASRADLNNALQAIGRAKNREAVLRHIRRRAKALGLEDTLPEWAVAKMVKCSCGDGDAKTLEVLRATSMADMDADDFNDVVAAVNEAGGVTKTVGLPRVLITKAMQQFQQGVAKGDYVGHPFRGNQYTDASGAGRGGSGGPKRTSTGRQARRRAGRFTAEEQRLALLNDTLAGRPSATAEAETFVQSMFDSQAEAATDVVARQIEGVLNVQRAAEDAAAQAQGDIERAEEYDEDSDSVDRYRVARIARNKVVDMAKRVVEGLQRASKMVERARKGVAMGADLKASQENAAFPLRSARQSLLELDRKLADAAETSRRMARSGYGQAHSSAAAQISLLRGGIREALGAINDLQADVNNMGEAALEVEEGIRGGGQ